MRFLVVGAGSWGTAFSRVLLERGHEVVLACRTREQAEAIASTGRNPCYLRSVDLGAAKAVALADASGEVDAVAVAAVDGLGLGDNAKASLISRGLAEMTRLGEAAGARPETFAGLAGIGDLVVSCCSSKTRNRHAGELIAQGLTPERAVAEIGQTVEGLTTAPVLRDLSHRLGVELPITEGVCSVLSGQSITDLAAGLMGRAPTEE